MKDLVLHGMELILVGVCKGFVLILGILDWLAKTIAKAVTLVIILTSFIVIIHGIDNLPAFWESLVFLLLFLSAALTFICIITLSIWKPKRFSKIFNK